MKINLCILVRKARNKVTGNGMAVFGKRNIVFTFNACFVMSQIRKEETEQTLHPTPVVGSLSFAENRCG